MKFLGPRYNTYLEYIRRTVQVMHVFDWNCIEKWELPPLQPIRKSCHPRMLIFTAGIAADVEAPLMLATLAAKDPNDDDIFQGQSRVISSGKIRCELDS